MVIIIILYIVNVKSKKSLCVVLFEKILVYVIYYIEIYKIKINHTIFFSFLDLN